MTTTPQTPQDDEMLAAELVLGLTEAEDTTAGRRRIATDPDFAQRVRFWQERFVAMTDTIDPVSPPKGVKKKILDGIFPKQRVPLLQRAWLWQGVSFAALALVAVLSVQLLEVRTRPDARPAVLTAQLVSDTSAVELIAVVEPVSHEIALRRVSGAPVPNRVLQLWAILPGQDPVSLGVLPDSETARVLVPEALRSQAAQITLAVSDEPVGGSPTGAPTGDVLAAGAMTEL